MKHLLIVGARGWGREVYDIARACIQAGEQLEVKGFLDDKADALESYNNYPPILGPVESYKVQKDDVFVCALGDVNYKKVYIKKESLTKFRRSGFTAVEWGGTTY